jgi:protease IV
MLKNSVYFMPLNPDQIIDRLKLKTQIARWRSVTILFGLLIGILLFSGNDKLGAHDVIDNKYIARVYIDGIIYDDAERIESLKNIAKNNKISALIMHINSPGGTVVGGENLYNSVLRISNNKPVVIVMGDVAASAAYMTAIAGNHLIGHKGTVTGSIGVIAQTFEVTELAKKIGINFHNFKSSPLKGGPLPTEELSPEMKDAMYGTIKDIYDTFFNMVAERRKIPLDELKIIADGRIFTGNQALKNGLIDAIGDEETALEWLKNQKKIKDLKIRDYALIKEPSKLDLLLGIIHKTGLFIEKSLSANLLFL